MDKITGLIGGKLYLRLLVGFFYLSFFLVSISSFIENEKVRFIITNIVFFGYIIIALYIIVRIVIKFIKK